MNRPAVRILLASAYAAVIVLIVIAADNGRLGGIMALLHNPPGADKLAHLLLVGGLAFAINAATRCRPLPVCGRDWLPGTVVCLPLSILEEVTQIHIPTRNFDFLDMLMNVVGVLLIGPLARRLDPPRPAPL